MRYRRKILITIILSAFLSACIREWPGAHPWQPPTMVALLNSPTPSLSVFVLPTRQPDIPILTPTPDRPKILPTLRMDMQQYQVQAGDTLGIIALKYGVDINTLVDANQLTDPDQLEVDQILQIPPPNPLEPGSNLKLLPNSELVYSPSSIGFDTAAFAKQYGGYLNAYIEEMDRELVHGPQIVDRVAREFSVNPRILLAVLEYVSGWVTQINPSQDTLIYPMGFYNEWRKGLYKQLSWAANNLNRGFYVWQINAFSAWVLADGSVIPISPTINPGTAGVQYLMSLLYEQEGWRKSVSSDGVYQVYTQFFGYPFDYTIDPLVPEDLVQPSMTLPFEKDQTWSFTGGPHAGWGDGSAWAAIDFAPPGDALGCVQSDAWITAVAPGLVVRSETGVVILDLDEDGYEQTGWSVLYLHVETRDRVQEGSKLEQGDRIGHPSCEGGVSNGTHIHLARRFNGEWIAADGKVPFNMDGWISSGEGIEYNGFLKRDGESIEAWDSRKPENQIQR
jgi:LasA protease